MPALLEAPGVPTIDPHRRQYRFSRDQYHQLGELGFFDRQRVELLRGEIITMSPLSWLHTLAVGNTFDVLHFAFAGAFWLNQQNPMQTDDSEPEPDLAVYRGARRDYTTHPRPSDAVLVVEVSVSSLRYDLTTKSAFYAEEGVPEYWVLDPEGRVLHVFREPRDGMYAVEFALAESESLRLLALPDVMVNVADLLP